MTAADDRAREEIAADQQIREALTDFLGAYIGEVLDLHRDWPGAEALADSIVDDCLPEVPTVRALMAEAAAKARVDALNEAADGLTVKRPFFVDCHAAHVYADAADYLRARARALTAAHTEGPGNAHPDMQGRCAHDVPYAQHCQDCEAGR